MLVDRVEEDLGRRDRLDRVLRVDRLEDETILRVVDARDAACLRLALGDQANDQVVFVVARIGDNDIGSAQARSVEDHRVATVTDDGDVAFHHRCEHLRLARHLLDDDDFLFLGEQSAREIRPDLPAANDQNEHVTR